MNLVIGEGKVNILDTVRSKSPGLVKVHMEYTMRRKRNQGWLEWWTRGQCVQVKEGRTSSCCLSLNELSSDEVWQWNSVFKDHSSHNVEDKYNSVCLWLINPQNNLLKGINS